METVTQTLPQVPARSRPRFRLRRVPPSGLGLVVFALVAGLVAAVLAPRLASGPSSPGGPGAGDGFAWLADLMSGDAVQVDPATGQVVARLAVAVPGQGFRLAQTGQLLVVVDDAGMLSIVDIQTLAVRGSYPAGADALVLVNATGVYVADLSGGSVARLDPDARPVGSVWSAGAALVHAALDGEGAVWALRGDGPLHRLVWTDGGLAEGQTPVTPSGAPTRAVLVAHDRGVTMVSPEAGLAQRLGTGGDGTRPIPRVSPALLPAATSPADLVPVSLAGSPTLLLVTGSSAQLVNLSPYGCEQPAPPVVLGDRVYVPCRGVGRVVPLDATGVHLPPVLTLGPGDPTLVVDEGRLFATVPGATQAAMVSPDGTTAPVYFVQPAPADVPGMVVTSRPPGRQQPPPPGQAGPPPSAPTGAGARAIVDGAVVVAFTPGTGAASYAILRADTGETVTADFVGRNDEGREVASVRGLPVGATLSLVVEARNAAGATRSAPTNQVTVFRIPGAPMNVRDDGRASTSGSDILISLTWDTVPGTPTHSQSYYQVTLTTDTGAQATVRSYEVPTDCPECWYDGTPEPIALTCDGCGRPPRGAVITATVSLMTALDYVTEPIATATSTFLYCDIRGACSR